MRILGVRDVRFLGLAEGTIAQGIEIRHQIGRVIRQVRPRTLPTWSPEWNWSWFRMSCHIDHPATGAAEPNERPTVGILPQQRKSRRVVLSQACHGGPISTSVRLSSSTTNWG